MILKIMQNNILFQYADLLYRIAEVKRSEKLARDSLHRLSRQRFEALLHHVFKHSAFYNALYRSQGVTPELIPEVTLEDLPVIDKQMMMDNYDSFVCDKTLKRNKLEAFLANPDNVAKKYKKRYQVIHTSGSTGQIGIYIYDLRAWNIIKALAITRVSKAKLNPFKKIKSAFIGATDGHYAGISLSRDAPKLFYDFRYFSVNRPMQEILKEIAEFEPTALGGYASAIALLALKQLQGELNLKLNSIICSGDQLTDSMRSDIAKAFTINPRNFYAASESLCMAAECHNHQGLHLFEDWHYYEVVNSEFQAVNAGTPGKLLLTTLYNYAQPLIRYQLYDEVILDPTRCDCGRDSTRIKKISGRSEEFLWFTLPDGKKEYLHPLQFVEFYIPGIEKFQIIQTEKYHLHMLMVVKGEPQSICLKAEDRISQILSEKGLNKLVTFSCEMVESIPADCKTAKFRLIVPYKGT